MTVSAANGTPDTPAAAPDPMALLKSRSYIQLLVLAALIGVPVSAVAYGFLKLVSLLQHWLFTSLPTELGFHGTPVWWSLPLLGVAGILVSMTIKYLPGRGGHSPADGFQAGGSPNPIDLPGVFLAALATLSLGVVLGPEAPLIAIGGGLGVLAVQLVKRDAPPIAAVVMAAAGSFAAISTLFGSPIAGAFLLMEAAGLGGPMLGLVLVPGLLAAGVGTLIFVGLDSLTGFGTFSLAIPGLPPFEHPTGAMFVWAIVFGLVAALVGAGIRLLGIGRPAPRRAADDLLDPCRRTRRGRAGRRLCRSDRAESPGRPFLWAVGTPRPGPARGRVDRAGPLAPRRLQGTGLWTLSLQLPRGSGVPVNVHRRGRGHRCLPPCRTLVGAGGGYGNRRHVHRDAEASPNLDPVGHTAAL